MYINFWYPVGKSDEITNDRPFQVQILGLRFVAFRDAAGAPHVISDTCIHRGGSLGLGKLKDGCVVCPYHGWEFAGDGRCTRIPTLADDQHAPPRAKVDSYPVQERYGILFAFLGDLPEEERPPLYQIPEEGLAGWRVNKLVVFTVNAYYERSVENGLNAAHNEFVHTAQGGPSIGETLKTHPMEVEDVVPWGSRFSMSYSGYADKDQRTLKAGIGETIAGSEHHGPNTLITRIQFTPEKKFHQYFFEAPIDGESTRIFFINMRCFMMEEENDQKIIDINMNIAAEDIRVIEALNPVRTPHTTTKEVLVPSDKPVVRYRQYLKEWEARGWRIDRLRMRAQTGDVAFAIPGPQRRSSKNWVLEPVPLMPGK